MMKMHKAEEGLSSWTETNRVTKRRPCRDQCLRVDVSLMLIRPLPCSLFHDMSPVCADVEGIRTLMDCGKRFQRAYPGPSYR